MNLRFIPSALELDEFAKGGHGDPFSILGMHQAEDHTLIVRTFQPNAVRVWLESIDNQGFIIDEFQKIHESGMFQLELDKEIHKFPFPYKLRVEYNDGGLQTIEDAYRFPSVIGEMDAYLLSEGNHLDLYKKMGAHLVNHMGVWGCAFAVWAPNARRVSVVGNFNNWDGRANVMRRRIECGVWDIFIPGIKQGDIYKYEIIGPYGNLLPLKTDPFGFSAEMRPNNASIVFDIDNYNWSDNNWLDKRKNTNYHESPINVYEVHLGSWRRNPAEGNRFLTYTELANELVPYVKELGFTHVEFLPISEHPFDGSWGYQCTGMFSPTSRFGTPAEFKYLIDRFHQEGIGVILDWVPGHFPKDGHGLANFDGTCLYEHMDNRKGEHMDWGTKIYNFGRREVINFLYSSALFWLREYHIDGLRVDAVASMLYLDYSREDGQWLPNEYGGNENLEAIAFLKKMNELVHAENTGIITFAEESTAWPMVSRPTSVGGLGFDFKWNMGWMHDTLEYINKEPVHRKYAHNHLTFGLLYAFNENFILPLSHDEVIHGKGSMFGKMPGDTWQKFANLRCYYTFMFTHPGKKLLFMGGEFAEHGEWRPEDSLNWDLLHYENLIQHQQVFKCVKDLNQLVKNNPSLYEVDFKHTGFEWINHEDGDNSVISYVRKAKNADDFLLVICNFTPVVRENYLVGVPKKGAYEEIFNSDSAIYGGSNVINASEIKSKAGSVNYRDNHISLTLPPLATIVLRLK